MKVRPTRPAALNSKKPVTLCVYFDQELRESLKARAASESRSVSGYLRRLVQQDLATASEAK